MNKKQISIDQYGIVLCKNESTNKNNENKYCTSDPPDYGQDLPIMNNKF